MGVGMAAQPVGPYVPPHLRASSSPGRTDRAWGTLSPLPAGAELDNPSHARGLMSLSPDWKVLTVDCGVWDPPLGMTDGHGVCWEGAG